MDAAQKEHFRHVLGEFRGDGDRLSRNAEAKPNSVIGEGGQEVVTNGINPTQMKMIGDGLLEDVKDALKRLDNNTFGICQDCGGFIPEERLECLPYVKRCAPCQKEHDKSKGLDFKSYV